MFNSQGNRKTPTASTSNDTSLIASGTHISGDLRFGGTLHLDGCVQGTIIADPDTEAVFTLSEQGQVSGEIRVPHAVVNGRVKGDIHVSERLELAAGARVDGDVHYRVLEMAAGAQVNGRMVHQTEVPRQLSAPEQEAMTDDTRIEEKA